MSHPTNFRNPYPWLLVFYLLAIYLTLPLLPPVVKWMRSSMGQTSIATVAPILTTLAAVVILARLGRRQALAFGLPWAVILGASAAILYLKRNNPVEQIHLVEYGLAGFLAYRSASFPGPTPRSRAAILAWTAVAVGAGILDEVIQGWLPNRVCDWRDMVLNTASAPVGLAVAALMGRPAATRRPRRGTAGPPA